MNNWKEFISEQSTYDYYKILTEKVKEEGKKYTIYPKHQDLFNAFKMCPLNEVKVVILGQDPYHGENQAHGLSFSVKEGIKIPPSLKNIFKEIKSDLNIKTTPVSGCLNHWAAQGVFLLNSILTVRKDTPGSHKNIGWEIFTDETIKLINKLNQPVVYLLWGSFAKEKKIFINNPKHLVLTAPHPSPLSAYNGFFGCKHFSCTNDFLIKNNVKPIDWFLI